MAVPVALILAAAQLVLGGVQAASAAKKAKRLAQQRTAYQTPEEIEKILQASQSMATQGYDPFTLNYLTNQTDRAFDRSAGLVSRYGDAGNVANDLSFLFDQKMNSIMKIGAENHARNMEHFGRYLQALGMRGGSADAEWQSRENMLKDQLQSAAAEKAAGIQNIGNAINTGIGAISAANTAKLYTQRTDVLKNMGAAGNPVGYGGSGNFTTPSNYTNWVD